MSGRRGLAAAVGASVCRVYLFVVQDLLASGHPPFRVGPPLVITTPLSSHAPARPCCGSTPSSPLV